MSLLIRLMCITVIFELLISYSCFAGQVHYDHSNVSFVYKDHNIQSYSSTIFSHIDVFEFLESEEQIEEGEEDISFSIGKKIFCHFLKPSIHSDEFGQTNLTLFALIFSEEYKIPLFVLFHSWKYHL
ncbi:MAG: hypothetical protein IPO92_01230 [Saprospiraceae bacterium]|nr:hypothetical protein [Saprospiraceae bacterium]